MKSTLFLLGSYHQRKVSNFKKRYAVLTTVILLSLLITGCNSTWFYRPDSKDYIDISNTYPANPQLMKSLSGNQLNTLLIPATAPSQKTLFVHFHGNAGNITWTSQRYEWLRHYGLDLFVFDYSGYGDSTGTPSPETTWLDALTILNHIIKRQEQNQRWDRIILAGTSLGGNILLNALATYPEQDKFDLVFIDSSFLSYKDVVSSLAKKGPGGFWVKDIARWFFSDEFAPEKYQSLTVNSRIVVAHCQTDKLVSIKLGQKVYDRISAIEKLWLPLENCEHAQGFNSDFPEHRQWLIEALF